MKATITITEQELEALNRLVTTGVVTIDSWQAEHCPDVRAAHEWLTKARQALVAAAEDPSPLGWTVGCVDQSDGVYVCEPGVQQTPAEVVDAVASHLNDNLHWEGFELTISPTTLRQLQPPTCGTPLVSN